MTLSNIHHIDFRKLRYFVAVAELGSFTKAADQLHIAQPALSRQVRLLEEELGLQLMERSGRGITLTDAGQVLLQHAHALVATLSHIWEDMQTRAGSPKGQVTIGIPPSCAVSFVPRLVERVQRDYPMISLRVAEGISLVLANWVELGTIDLAVLSYPVDSRALHMEPLATEDIVIFEKASHPDIPAVYSLAAMSGKPLMLSKTFTDIIRSALQLPSLTFNALLEIDAIQVIQTMVLKGSGAAMLPVSLLQEEMRSGLVTGSAITSQGVRRTLCLARPVHRHPSKAIEAAAQALKDEVAQLEQEGVFSLQPRARPVRQPASAPSVD